jgi:hypothetical protein
LAPFYSVREFLSSYEGTIVDTCIQIGRNMHRLWQSSRNCLPLIVSYELSERQPL